MGRHHTCPVFLPPVDETALTAPIVHKAETSKETAGDGEKRKGETYRTFQQLTSSTTSSQGASVNSTGAAAAGPADWPWTIGEYQLFYKVKRVMPNARYAYIEGQYSILLDEARERKYPSRHAKDKLLARVAQQRLIRILLNTEGFVDMQPPGSQAHLYERGEDGRPASVWYASYGSNMSKERFFHYLQGGTPEGSPKQHYGARDTSEPTGDIKLVMPGIVHFACSSKAWGGGGSAFLDPHAEGESLSRAYRITAEQFDDVILQENNGDPSTAPVAVDINAALRDGKVKTTGRYNTLVHVGDYDGAPVFTLTGDFTIQDAMGRKKTITPEGSIGMIADRAEVRKKQRRKVKAAKILRRIWIPIKPISVDHDIRTNAPSPAYLAMMEKGLKDLGLDDAQTARYFRGATGVPLPKQEKTEEKKASTVKTASKLLEQNK